VGILDYRFTWSVMTWAVLAGPVIGLVSAGYIRLIGWVSHHRARGTRALFAPVIAFGILGVIVVRRRQRVRRAGQSEGHRHEWALTKGRPT